MAQPTATIQDRRAGGSAASPGTDAAPFGWRPTLPFDQRPVLRAMAVIVGTLIGLLAFGYAVLLRHLDPGDALRAVEERLAYGVLSPGEEIESRVPISRRSARSYFRSSHGELVATDRRLLLLLVDPPHAGAEIVERIVVSVRELAKDTTVTLEPSRPALGLDGALTISTPMGRRAYSVRDESWPAMEALVANLRRAHAEQYASAEAARIAAKAARQARIEAEEAARLPIRYQVLPGDALATIARRFDTTPERLRELNGLTTDRIRAGDTLLVRPGSGG